MSFPLISVIVPIYNVEEYLNQCIKSIVNQTYKNLEIILVDDGSPDNSPAICDAWANRDKRIKVIHKENGGVSSSRNVGIDVSTGDYIGFVDGDDYIDIDMYEFLMNNLIKNDADVCCCNFRCVKKSGDIYSVVEGFSDSSKNHIFSKDELIKKYFSCNDGQWVSFCNKIIKKSAFDNLRFPIGRIFEDWTLAPMVYNNCEKICFLSDEKYNYVIHEDSAMRTFTVKRYYDCVLADYDHYNYFSEINSEYNCQIERFIWLDFNKCIKVYKSSYDNKLILKDAFKKAKEVSEKNLSDKITNRLYLKGCIFYAFKNIIPFLYKILKNR